MALSACVSCKIRHFVAFRWHDAIQVVWSLLPGPIYAISAFASSLAGPQHASGCAEATTGDLMALPSTRLPPAWILVA